MECYLFLGCGFSSVWLLAIRFLTKVFDWTVDWTRSKYVHIYIYTYISSTQTVHLYIDTQSQSNNSNLTNQLNQPSPEIQKAK